VPARDIPLVEPESSPEPESHSGGCPSYPSFPDYGHRYLPRCLARGNVPGFRGTYQAPPDSHREAPRRGRL